MRAVVPAEASSVMATPKSPVTVPCGCCGGGSEQTPTPAVRSAGLLRVAGPPDQVDDGDIERVGDEQEVRVPRISVAGLVSLNGPALHPDPLDHVSVPERSHS
jgi:hypothetical protein